MHRRARYTQFPGFDVEIQGVYKEADDAGRIRLYTYVATE